MKNCKESIIDGKLSVFAEHIVIGNYGAFQTDDVATSGYYMLEWKSIPYVLSELYVCYAYNPPKIIPEVTYMCKAKFLNPLGTNSFW